MFREMRRKNQVLPENITAEVLEKGSNGIMSVIGDDGYPYGVQSAMPFSMEKSISTALKQAIKSTP